MGRFCEACRHAQVRKIDAMIRSGATLTHIAQRYGLTVSAVQRHKSNHVAALAAKSQVAAVAADGAPSTIVGKLNSPEAILAAAEALVCRTESLLNLAEADGDVRSALQAVKIMLDGLTGFFAKYHRMIDETPRVDSRTVNIFAGVPTEKLRELRDSLMAGVDTQATAVLHGADH